VLGIVLLLGVRKASLDHQVVASSDHSTCSVI
jgi:hypothetical protein